MKWVRHRCQLAPGRVERIASTRPTCASEITNVTPARPRATRPRRNANQRAPSSVVKTLGIEGLSESQASRMANSLDDDVEAR